MFSFLGKMFSSVVVAVSVFFGGHIAPPVQPTTLNASDVSSVVASTSVSNSPSAPTKINHAKTQIRTPIVTTNQNPPANIIATSTVPIVENTTHASSTLTLDIMLGKVNVTSDSVQISWTLNMLATSRVTVMKGATSSNEIVAQIVPSVSGPTAQELVTIPNLVANTEYSFIVDATAGSQHKSINGTFTTPLTQQMQEQIQQEADLQKWKATYVCPNYDSRGTCYDPRFPSCYFEKGGGSGCGG